MKEPFKDLTVIELASVLAGPSVGLFFAELGARVIKVENKKTNGDITRKWKVASEEDDQLSAYYTSINRGKESVFLDLTDERDQNELKELLKTADVVVTNFKKKFAESQKLRSEDFLMYNERLIVANVTGYTHKDAPAFDVLLQAETGYISMTGHPDKLAKMPVAMIDVLAGHQLKEAILVKLLEREKTGKGAIVEVSLFDSAIAGLVNQASNVLVAHHVPRPMGTAHPNIVPYGDLYKSADDILITIAVGTDSQWERLSHIDDRLLNDAWKRNVNRVKDRDHIHSTLESIFSQQSGEHWIDLFRTINVPAARVSTVQEVLDTEYVRKNLVYDGGVRAVTWREL